MKLKYDRKTLIHCLVVEYERLCHDVPEDDDLSLEEYEKQISSYSYDQLIEETGTDDEYLTLADYVELYHY